MAYERSNSVAIGSLVVGAAAIVVGVLLYRRSGRDWQSDLKVAKGWIEDRTDDAQGVLERTEKSSKELLASAQDYGAKAIGTAKGTLEGVRERVS